MKFSDYRRELEKDEEYQAAADEFKLQFALGDAVLKARMAKGWTQSELARRAGTKQANISRIEAGLANPTLNLIGRLCDVLGLALSFVTSSQHTQVDELASDIRRALVEEGESLESMLMALREVRERYEPGSELDDAA